MKTEDASTWILERSCICDGVIFHTRIVTGHNWYRRGSNPPSQYVNRKHSCLTCLVCARHLSQCFVPSSPVSVLCSLVACHIVVCTRHTSQCCVNSSPVTVLCSLVACLSVVCTLHLSVLCALVTFHSVLCTRHLSQCCVHSSHVTVLCALVTCLSVVCIQKKGTVTDE
jgi:hypothetical protein